jgi:hypothetical protein
MRYPKYLINAFAILGVASFIFLACSASETAMNEDPIENGGDNGGDNGDGGDGGDNNPPIQNNYGKYQIATSIRTASWINITILNTETGQVSLYKTRNDETGIFELLRTENIAN